MGSYQGAEVCDLIGLYLLHKLSPILDNGAYGLYRDDGLCVVKGRSGTEWERLKKTIRNAFAVEGFKITLEGNLHKTDFLDVVLDMRKNEYLPFRKENSKTLYINNGSNHPRYVRNAISEMTRKRISGLSKTQELFDQARSAYDNALSASGHAKMGSFNTSESKTRKRKRKRKVIYFHPPYCTSVKTKIGKEFLKLVDKHFPSHHKLRPIFNRSTLKVSYSALPNVKASLQRHNGKILRKHIDENTDRTCNCRNPGSCPVENNCLKENVIYKATVTTIDDQKEYIGSSCTTFKTRYNNHMSSFRASATLKKKQSTTLSTYIHKLKETNKQYDIEWKIIDQKRVNKNTVSKICSICNLERLTIALADKKKSLNKRAELTSKCPHLRSAFL